MEVSRDVLSSQHLQRYLTHVEWKLLLDTRTTWKTCIQAVVHRLEVLGILWPSEHTALLVWCIFITARCHPSHTVFSDCVIAFQQKTEVMAVAKAHRERLIDYPVGAGEIRRYPSSVAAFKAQYPHIATLAHTDDLREMVSQVDERTLYQAKSFLPCRSNHKGMHVPRGPGRPSKARPVQAAAQGLRSSRSFSEDDCPIPGLTIFDAPQRVPGGRPALADAGAAAASAIFGGVGGGVELSLFVSRDEQCGSQRDLLSSAKVVLHSCVLPCVVRVWSSYVKRNRLRRKRHVGYSKC